MRTAAICDTCATYINAKCIIYDGDYLTNLGVAPLDALDVILGKINNAIPPDTGCGAPTFVPTYVGEFYLDTCIPILYVGLSITSPDWGIVDIISTTTTTTTHP